MLKAHLGHREMSLIYMLSFKLRCLSSQDLLNLRQCDALIMASSVWPDGIFAVTTLPQIQHVA